MAFTNFQFLLVLTFSSLANACPVPQCACDADLGLIDCSQRRLSAVPSFRQVDSTYFALNLSGNSIQQIADSAFVPGRFRQIDLRQNPLKSNGIHKQAFAGLETVLEELSIGSSTELADYIPKETDMEFLLGLTALKSLSVVGFRLNLLYGLMWQHFTGLKELALDSCRIVMFQPGAFAGQLNNTLERLSITNDQYVTRIQSNTFDHLYRLRQLTISRCRIDDVSITSNDVLPPNVETIDVSYNKLTRFDLRTTMLQLQSLDLSHNPLIQWSRSSFGNNLQNAQFLNLENTGMTSELLDRLVTQSGTLKKLSLDNNNRLADIPSGFRFSSLEWLSLKGSAINKLRPSQLAQYAALSYLDLSNSYNLTRLEPGSLSVRNNITLLLENCQITGELSEETSNSWHLIESLDLSGNPLWCNCSTFTLISSNEFARSAVKGKCAGPDELNGTELAALSQVTPYCAGVSPYVSQPNNTSVIIIATVSASLFLFLIIGLLVVGFIFYRKKKTYETNESLEAARNAQAESLLRDNSAALPEPFYDQVPNEQPSQNSSVLPPPVAFNQRPTRPPRLPPRPLPHGETTI